MELKELVSYKSAFASMKVITVAAIVGSLVFAGGVFIYAEVAKSEMQSRVIDYASKQWVLDPKSGAVISFNKSDNTAESRELEYKHHVRLYYKHMFHFDQYSFENNVTYALNLIGDRGEYFVEMYDEKNIYRTLRERNMSVVTEIDLEDIEIDYSGNPPYEGKAVAVQRLIDSKGEKKRHWDAVFTIEDTEARTDINPHMAIIRDFRIVNSKKVEKR